MTNAPVANTGLRCLVSKICK